MRVAVYALVVVLLPISAWTQSQRPIAPVPLSQEDFLSNKPSSAPTSLKGQEYRVGPDDLLEFAVFEVPELSATARVTASGMISYPILGGVQVSGLTPQEIERLVAEGLKKNYLNDPRVTVFVREYASQPVSVSGAVRMPSIYQMKGQKSLLDMLAMAQGLDSLTAGDTIQVMRRNKETAETRTISISVQDLYENGKSELNIPIEAGDSIIVLQARSVFVIGEVVQPGEVVLKHGRGTTVAQAIATGRGFTREAKKKECSIIRIHRDGTRQEIRINAEKIMDGSLDDVPMMPDDILFVPANKLKTGLMKALDSTIGIVSGRLIYRF